MSDKCKKCSGSGEAFGGVCFECGGSGEVNETRYQTISPEKSKHPALIAERKMEKTVLKPARPDYVKAQLDEIKSLIVQASVVIDELGDVKMEVEQWLCEHEFKVTHNFTMCRHCGIFESQWVDYLQTNERIASYRT